MKALNPFVRKSVTADDATGLWPNIGTRDAGALGRNGFLNFTFFTNTPTWQSLISLQELFNSYHTNPVFFATVMIKAREYSNMRIKVMNRSSGLQEDATTRKTIPAKIYRLFNEPNVLQSRWEFLMQRKIFEEVCGNSFTYGNFSLGMKPSIENITSLWNVWPQHMKFKTAGKYFEATKLDDIIKEWRFELGNYIKTWKPEEIMHKNKANTSAADGLIFGRSTASSLTRPLSNIEMAYESRNVIMKNRGMRVIMSSAKQDASGPISLTDEEWEAQQLNLKKYGTLEHQNQFFISQQPLDVTPIDQDVSKLGLFEEIQSDAMMVGNAYGVPMALLSLTIKGSTYENQEASVRRLYQGALIPEATDDMIAFTTFLGLDDTEWYLEPDFSHIAALQESELVKAQANKFEKDIAMNEYARRLITAEEYRERMNYGPMPTNGTFANLPTSVPTEITPNA